MNNSYQNDTLTTEALIKSFIRELYAEVQNISSINDTIGTSLSAVLIANDLDYNSLFILKVLKMQYPKISISKFIG